MLFCTPLRGREGERERERGRGRAGERGAIEISSTHFNIAIQDFRLYTALAGRFWYVGI